MNVRVLFFGMIAEAVKSSHYIITDYNGKTIGELEDELRKKFPQLADFTYQIALNQSTVDRSATLTRENEVAILPPFAGG
jgi:molybdopterin converting factor small subunit